MVSSPPKGFLRTAAAFAALIIVPFHAAKLLPNLPVESVRRDATAAEYSELLFDNAPRDALVFIDHVADDTIIPPVYFQFMRHQRRDLFLLHRLYLAFPWYLDYMRARAAEEGYATRMTEIDMDEERYQLYAVTLEEKQLLDQSRTMNTISIDIQTRKLLEDNLGAQRVAINTPSRYRRSLLSKGFKFTPCGGLFHISAYNKPLPPRNCGPPGPLSNPGASIVYDALLRDYFYEKSVGEAMEEDFQAALDSLRAADARGDAESSRRLRDWLYLKMKNGSD